MDPIESNSLPHFAFLPAQRCAGRKAKCGREFDSIGSIGSRHDSKFWRQNSARHNQTYLL